MASMAIFGVSQNTALGVSFCGITPEFFALPFEKSK
jgi:hypothetical protein